MLAKYLPGGQSMQNLQHGELRNEMARQCDQLQAFFMPSPNGLLIADLAIGDRDNEAIDLANGSCGRHAPIDLGSLADVASAPQHLNRRRPNVSKEV